MSCAEGSALGSSSARAASLKSSCHLARTVTCASCSFTLPPGGVSEDVIVGEGEKGGLVLDGSVQLKIGSELFDLDEGDSFQFPSSGPHALSNIKAEPAQVVWIMSVLDSHI